VSRAHDPLASDRQLVPSITACDIRKELPFAGYSVVKELSILPRRAVIASSTRFETLLPARDVARSGKNVVENTGLEPVTSWLQTRRSPS
jgi:hypothetical protein